MFHGFPILSDYRSAPSPSSPSSLSVTWLDRLSATISSSLSTCASVSLS